MRIRRVHSSLIVRIIRSTTAILPCLPTAPYRGGLMPLHLTHCRKAWQSKIRSLSQTMYFGALPTLRIDRPNSVHTERQSGRLAKAPIPTMRRENKSRMTARYSQPCCVHTYVISATHARSGASTVNSLSSTLSATGSLWSESVVFRNRGLRRPTMPFSRIRRATRLRPTSNPWATSSACTRGLP